LLDRANIGLRADLRNRVTDVALGDGGEWILAVESMERRKMTGQEAGKKCKGSVVQNFTGR